MRRAAATAAGIVALAVAWAAAAGPHGRVVRVERNRGVHRTPLMCQVMANGPSGTGQCWGLAPRMGEVASVLDDSGVLGEIRVTTVEEQTKPGCTEPLSWTFGFVRASGHPDRGQAGAIALFDLDVVPGRSHGLDATREPLPDARKGVSPWHAIDQDGDGVADVYVTAYPCDDEGTPLGTTTGWYCIDYWVASHHVWRMVRRDRASACSP